MKRRQGKSFQELPDDMIREIATHLSSRDLLHLAQAKKIFRKILEPSFLLMKEKSIKIREKKQKLFDYYKYSLPCKWECNIKDKMISWILKRFIKNKEEAFDIFLDYILVCKPEEKYKFDSQVRIFLRRDKKTLTRFDYKRWLSSLSFDQFSQILNRLSTFFKFEIQVWESPEIKIDNFFWFPLEVIYSAIYDCLQRLSDRKIGYERIMLDFISSCKIND